MSRLTRRRFIAYSAAGTGFTAIGGLTSLKFASVEAEKANSTAKKLKISIHPVLQSGVPRLVNSIQFFRNQLIRLSGGELEVVIDHAGADGMISSAPLEFTNAASLSKQFFAGHPVEQSAVKKRNWLMLSEVEHLWDQSYVSEGFKPLLMAVGSTESVLMVRAQSVDEESIVNQSFAATRFFLKQTYGRLGVKVKTQMGGPKQWLRSVGDTTIGVLDPVRPQVAVGLGLHKNSDLVAVEGNWLGPQVFHLLLSNSSWNSLSRDEQKILREASALTTDHFLASSQRDCKNCLRVFDTRRFVRIPTWEKRFQHEYFNVLRDTAKVDGLARKIWSSYESLKG